MVTRNIANVGDGGYLGIVARFNLLSRWTVTHSALRHLPYCHRYMQASQHPANMKLTEKQIEEIADNLDCGMRCFYNLKTGEIKTILNFDNWIAADEEPWEIESKEIDDNRDDYFEFEGMETHDSFRLMADFTESIDNSKLQEKLINALNKSKPFSNFKWQIDNSGDCRQEWFDFKKMRYIKWVKDQIDINTEYNNE